MLYRLAAPAHLLCVAWLSLSLMGCFHPPYNNFKKDNSSLGRMAMGTGVGVGVGAIAGSVVGNTGAGALIGGMAGAALSYDKRGKKQLIESLQQQDIQYVQYGDTMTLIVPTDRYFVFDSDRLNDICYPGLLNIVKLLKAYPQSPIYVAAFTDNVDKKSFNQKLTAAQAETMLSFLWANDIPAQRLHAKGYGEEYPIGDNNLVHGSAYNRRLEIQWFNGCKKPAPVMAYLGPTK